MAHTADQVIAVLRYIGTKTYIGANDSKADILNAKHFASSGEAFVYAMRHEDFKLLQTVYLRIDYTEV